MALARFNFSIQDDEGNIVDGATVTVQAESPGLPLAALKSDRAGATPMANPYVASDGADPGFFVIGGFYRITVTKDSFTRTWEYVGIGLNSGGDSAASRAKRVVTAAGAVTVDPEDEVIIIKKTVGAPTTVNVDWSVRTKDLTIVDGKGDAATNPISIVPASGQTQYGIVDYVVTIDGNGGNVTLGTLPDQTGGY